MVVVAKGIFDASLARILIYMTLVDLLDADFMNPSDTAKNKHHKNVCHSKYIQL